MTNASLDWEECLRLSNNKEDLAKDLLQMLANELPTYQIELKKAAESNDLENLRHHAHKLHGACCYTGVPRLRQLTEQLESQLNAHPEDPLNGIIQEIDQEISNVITAIEEQ